MPKYIDADEFVSLKREWYCDQCEKRKGMKRGRLQFVYEMGGPPCRACDVDDMISDIEAFPAADVEPRRESGMWIEQPDRPNVESNRIYRCSVCGYADEQSPTAEVPYCWHCGSRMRKMKKEDE